MNDPSFYYQSKLERLTHIMTWRASLGFYKFQRAIYSTGVAYPRALWGRKLLYSFRTFQLKTLTYRKVLNHWAFRHSSRDLPWKLSHFPFGQGLPGSLNNDIVPWEISHPFRLSSWLSDLSLGKVCARIEIPIEHNHPQINSIQNQWRWRSNTRLSSISGASVWKSPSALVQQSIEPEGSPRVRLSLLRKFISTIPWSKAY